MQIFEAGKPTHKFLHSYGNLHGLRTFFFFYSSAPLPIFSRLQGMFHAFCSYMAASRALFCFLVFIYHADAWNPMDKKQNTRKACILVPLAPVIKPSIDKSGVHTCWQLFFNGAEAFFLFCQHWQNSHS